MSLSFTLAHFYHIFSASIRHLLCACVNAPHIFASRVYTDAFSEWKSGMSAFWHIRRDAENASERVHLHWQICCVVENAQIKKMCQCNWSFKIHTQVPTWAYPSSAKPFHHNRDFPNFKFAESYEGIMSGRFIHQKENGGTYDVL